MKLNRTLVLCLSIVLAASMALGGTLAFLTDTESKVNEFTVGDVDIDLWEDFEDGATLTPGVDVTKRVYIKNIGHNDAYVWFTYALPVIANHDTDASQNVLHTNTRGKYWDTYRNDRRFWDEDQNEAVPENKTWNVDYYPDADGNDTATGMPITYVDVPTALDENGRPTDYVEYAVYANLYHGVLKPESVDPDNCETTPGMEKVYLDQRLDYIRDEDGNGMYYFVENGVATPLLGRNEDGEGNPIGIDQLKVIVNAYAIQYDGLENETVFGAFQRYLGQWGMQTLEQNVVDAAVKQLEKNAANP